MHIDRFERYWIILASVMLGVFFATVLAAGFVFGIRPSSDGTGNTFVNPNTLSEPNSDPDKDFSTLGITSVGERAFEVRMLAQMWVFNFGGASPQAMIDAGAYIDTDENGQPVVHVREGDRVTFIITSRDITHGFMIQQHNINFEVVPGHIARSTVVFSRPGEYALVCHEYCGINHQNMYAHVVVSPADPESVAQSE